MQKYDNKAYILENKVASYLLANCHMFCVKGVQQYKYGVIK